MDAKPAQPNDLSTGLEPSPINLKALFDADFADKRRLSTVTWRQAFAHPLGDFKKPCKADLICGNLHYLRRDCYFQDQGEGHAGRGTEGNQERAGLAPGSVRELVRHGHRVIVRKHAGGA